MAVTTWLRSRWSMSSTARDRARLAAGLLGVLAPAADPTSRVGTPHKHSS
ncbi:Uncharacterised protein [Mycobacteroides abscessus subsp. abscessus]|nr:Uncharacterised protein [Mycobacteroides abscessus subsp. abscessus]